MSGQDVLLMRAARRVVSVFTGLVQELGRVAEVESRDGATRIRVEAALAGELSEGDSVAVNGVCLTAVGPADGHFDGRPQPRDRGAQLARRRSRRASR